MYLFLPALPFFFRLSVYCCLVTSIYLILSPPLLFSVELFSGLFVVNDNNEEIHRLPILVLLFLKFVHFEQSFASSAAKVVLNLSK